MKAYNKNKRVSELKAAIAYLTTDPEELEQARQQREKVEREKGHIQGGGLFSAEHLAFLETWDKENAE